MEDNNYNPQNGAPASTADREDQPQMDFQATPPTFEQQPMSQLSNPELDAYVNDAFGKGLAAIIIAEFPIGSIIAIALGSSGLNLVQTARDKANQSGVKLSGKNIVAKVLSMVGKFVGIANTIAYGVLILVYIIYFLILLGLMEM